MLDEHYPTVEINFLDSIIRGCENVIDVIETAQTKGYILTGQQPIRKRTIIIRNTDDGQVSFLHATGIASRLKCMGKLLVWFETNRNWKDGAYIEK